jgi:hypothetical protein
VKDKGVYVHVGQCDSKTSGIFLDLGMMELQLPSRYGYSYSTVPAQFIFLDGSAFVRIPDLTRRGCRTIKGICSSVRRGRGAKMGKTPNLAHPRRSFLTELEATVVSSRSGGGTLIGAASKGLPSTDICVAQRGVRPGQQIQRHSTYTVRYHPQKYAM